MLTATNAAFAFPMRNGKFLDRAPDGFAYGRAFAVGPGQPHHELLAPMESRPDRADGGPRR
jgi:hypothetical protein